MKKYLVTGGSGFIGSSLVKRLIKDGNQVKVFDDNSRGNLRRLQGFEKDFEFIQGDIRNFSEVEQVCRGVDSVCHLAYINGTKFFYEYPELVLEVAIKGITNVIDGCIKNEVPELILASSSEVYQTPPLVPTNEEVPLLIPDPLNPRYSYGGGKIISELMALNYGRKSFERVIIFRPHNVYGPDMGWEHVIPEFILRMNDLFTSNNQEKFEFQIEGSGKETRAFIYIDDFIKGLMKVINLGEHLNIYHIGTDDEIELSNLAKKIALIFNKEIEVIPGDLKKGGTLRRCPDISKLQGLGFKKSYPLNDGLKQCVEWYLSNIELKPDK